MQIQVQKFETRQRRAQAYMVARRDELEPVRLERNVLLQELEILLARFVSGAIPDLNNETLQPLQDAAIASHTAFDPLRLVKHLTNQREMAEKLCARYEADFNIYQLAEHLPEQELKLAASKARMMEARRQLDRMAMELEPLESIPEELQQRRKGLSHVMSLMFDKPYREARRKLNPLGDIAARQMQQNNLLQELLIREQIYDVNQAETQRQRNWVEAFVTAWTSRPDEKLILTAVRQSFADALHDTLYRAHIAALFDRRWPSHIDQLFEAIDQLDRQTRQFVSDFDTRYADQATDY